MNKRQIIIARDQSKCQICGKYIKNFVFEGQIDHLIPKSRGGGCEISNLYLTCRECNNKRSNRANQYLLDSIVKKSRNVVSLFDMKLIDYEIRKGSITKRQLNTFINDFTKIFEENKQALLDIVRR